MLFVFSHVLIFLEAGLLLTFYGLFFQSRFSLRKTVIAIFLSAGTFMLSCDIIDLLAQYIWESNVTITFLWSLSVCSIISMALYRCGPARSFAVAALYYAVLLALQYLGRCTLALLNQEILEDYGWPFHLLRLTSLCFIAIFYLLCRKYFSRRSAETTQYSYNLCLLCAAALASSFLLWTQTESLPSAASGSLQILFITFALVLLYRFERVRTLQEKIHLSQLHSRLLEQNLNDVERIQKMNVLKRHDLLDHITAIRAAAMQKDWDSVTDYLQTLDKDLPNSPTIVHTENTTANAIINNKYAFALEEKIDFSVDAEVPSNIRIRPHDLCAILGNLLDNAIEACIVEDASKPRAVAVRISSKRDFLIIRISNTVSKNPLLQNPKFISTKNGVEHGVGLTSVRMAIAPYQGVMEHYFKDGLFNVLVTLCFTQNT